MALMVIFGCFKWPPIQGDAFAFYPPAIHALKGQPFANVVWTPAATHDAQGLPRLTYHGFLFSAFLKYFNPGKGYAGMLLLVSITSAVVVLATAFGAARLLNIGSGTPTWEGIVASALVPPAVASAAISVSDRPEILVMVITAWLLVVALVRSSLEPIPVGVALGFAGLASPVASIILGLACAVAVSLKASPQTLMLWTAKCLAASGVIAVAVWIAVYPYGLADWIHGNLHHARTAVVAGGMSQFGYYWFTSPGRSGLGVVTAAALFGSWMLGRKTTASASQSLALTSCLAVGLITAIWYFAARVPARSYNMSGVYPLLILLSIVPLSSSASNASSHATLRRLTGLFVLFGLLWASVPVLRLAAVFPSFLTAGLRYDNAHQAIEEALNKTSGEVWVTNPLLTAHESDRIRTFDLGGESPKGEYAFIAQAFTGLSEPPLLIGYEMIEDHFTSHVPRLFGIRLASSPLGYNYALYRRSSPASQLSQASSSVGRELAQAFSTGE